MIEQDSKTIEKILMHCDKLAKSVSRVQTYNRFLTDYDAVDAAITRIVQICKLSRKGLSGRTRITLPEDFWKKIYMMKNQLVIDYDSIDLLTLWNTISCDIPDVATSLRKHLKCTSTLVKSPPVFHCTTDIKKLNFRCKELLESHDYLMMRLLLLDDMVLALQTVINNGCTVGYEFFNKLNEHSESGQSDWMMLALNQYCDLHDDDPEKYPAVTFFELLNAVAAYRSEKKLCEASMNSRIENGFIQLYKMKLE